MSAVSIPSRKMPWQTKAERVSVLAALAIKKEMVMQRLLKLREEEGHPEKPGKPLPAEDAALRAGVKYRTWQRWEAGDSIPYARNLSAIADAFGFDVGEFYDDEPKKTRTPSPFPPVNADERLARMEFNLQEHARIVEQMLETQNELLDRQSKLLEKIECAVERVDSRLDQEDDPAKWAARVEAMIHQVPEASAPAAETQESAPGTHAKRKSPRG